MGFNFEDYQARLDNAYKEKEGDEISIDDGRYNYKRMQEELDRKYRAERPKKIMEENKRARETVSDPDAVGSMEYKLKRHDPPETEDPTQLEKYQTFSKQYDYVIENGKPGEDYITLFGAKLPIRPLESYGLDSKGIDSLVERARQGEDVWPETAAALQTKNEVTGHGQWGPEKNYAYMKWTMDQNRENPEFLKKKDDAQMKYAFIKSDPKAFKAFRDRFAKKFSATYEDNWITNTFGSDDLDPEGKPLGYDVPNIGMKGGLGHAAANIIEWLPFGSHMNEKMGLDQFQPTPVEWEYLREWDDTYNKEVPVLKMDVHDVKQLGDILVQFKQAAWLTGKVVTKFPKIAALFNLQKHPGWGTGAIIGKTIGDFNLQHYIWQKNEIDYDDEADLSDKVMARIEQWDKPMWDGLAFGIGARVAAPLAEGIKGSRIDLPVIRELVESVPLFFAGATTAYAHSGGNIEEALRSGLTMTLLHGITKGLSPKEIRNTVYDLKERFPGITEEMIREADAHAMSQMKDHYNLVDYSEVPVHINRKPGEMNIQTTNEGKFKVSVQDQNNNEINRTVETFEQAEQIRKNYIEKAISKKGTTVTEADLLTNAEKKQHAETVAFEGEVNSLKDKIAETDAPLSEVISSMPKKGKRKLIYKLAEKYNVPRQGSYEKILEKVQEKVREEKSDVEFETIEDPLFGRTIVRERKVDPKKETKPVQEETTEETFEDLPGVKEAKDWLDDPKIGMSIKDVSPIKGAVERLTKKVEDVEEHRKVFAYQDMGAEVLVHDTIKAPDGKRWWPQTNEEGYSYRYIMEGTGDILREFGLAEQRGEQGHGQAHFSPGYINEKVRRTREQVNRELRGKGHPDDMYKAVKDSRPIVLEAMAELFEKQPTNTQGQELARKLNVAMAKGDFKAADGYLKTLEKLIKGDSKAFHKWANKPIDRVKDKIKAWIQDPKIGLGIKDVSKEQVKFFSETSVKDKEGIPKKVYHGTRAPGFNNFEKGDIGFHFGTQEQANRVVKPRYEGEKNMAHLDKGGRVIEAYINIKNPIRLEEPYGGDWRNPDSIIGQLKKLGFKDLPKEKLNRAFGETSNAKTVKRYLEDIKDYLREKGYDGIVYRNQYEGMQPEAALLEGKDRDGWDWLRTEGSEKERVEFLRGIEAKPEYEGDQLGSDSYITFTAQQIKSVYNLKPESPEVAPRSLTGKSREVINEVEDIIASDSKFARFSAEQMQRKDIVKTFKDLKLKPKDRRGDRKVDYLRGIVQHLKDQVTSPKWGMSIEDVSGGKYDMDIKNRESKKREGKVRISAVDRKALGNDKEVANWKTYIINHPVSEGWAPMNPHRTPKGALVYKSESVDTFIHPPELYKKHILKGTKVPTTNAVKQRREQWKVEMMGKLRNETLGIVERANNGDAAAVTMLRQIEWYSNLKGKIRKQYGAYLDVFGDLLGAFSPQEKVHINFEYAQQALTEMHKGTYDAAMTEFVNYLEAGGTVSSYNGPKIMKLNNKLFGSNSKNGMLAVLGLWGKITVNSKSKTAPKARQFTRNIMGEPGVTIDVWAVRMLRRLAGARRIAPKAEKGVGGQHQSETDLQDISGAYGFAKDVFEGAAKDLRRSNIAMFSKLKGADLQAIQWFNEKHIWGKKGWTNEMGGSIEQQMELNPMSRLHTMLAVQQKDVPTNKVQARSQDLLLEATKNDPNVLVNKAIATLGYSKWGAERAIDSEVVVKKGTFPEKYFETALDIAIKENQDLFGLSEVLGSGDAAFSHPNSRPGVEIYFKPGTTNKKIMPILKSFQKHGFDGFMFVKEARESSPLGQTITQKGKGEKATFDLGKKDLKENSIGIRLQIVPEIDYRFGKITKEQLATDGFMDKYIGEKIDGLVGLTNKLQGHKLVADANFYSYNTLAIGKENYGKYKSLRSYNKEFNSGLTVEEAVRRFAAGEIRGRQNLPSKDLGPKKTVTQSIKDGVIDYLKNPKMGMSIQDLSTPKHTEKILELEEKVNAGAEMVIFGDQKVSKSKSYNLLKRFFDKVNFIKPIKRLGYVKIDTEQKANAHDAIYQWNGDIAEGKYIIDQNYKTMAKSLTPEQQADLTHVLELRTRTPGSRGPMKKIDIETNKKITELLNDPNAANDPAVSHAANVIRKRLDVIHGMLKKMNPDIGFIEEYIPHMWESTSKQNKSLVNRLGTRIPFEKGRFIPTYAEGIEMGLKPRFKSALDLLKIYENTAIRAVANFNLAQNMRAITNKDGHKMLNTKDKSPDWPTVDHWALGKHTQVDPEIYPFVNAIFSERFGGANASLGQQRFIKGMEGYNAYSKAASLAFSAFHVGALAESGIAMGQHPFAYKRGKKLIDTDPHIVRGALRHGLQIDVTADAQKQRVDKLLNKWANANVPLWKQAGKGVQAYKNWFDTAMWENYHTGHKLAAYHRHYAKELARSLKKKDGRSSEAIGREIAQFVNDAFGGQNWELLLKSQKWQQLGSGIFLAPDWTMSNLRIAANLRPGFLGGKETTSRKARGYWIRAALNYFLLSNMMNQVMVRLDPEEKKYRDDNDLSYNMYDNTINHKVDIYWGRDAEGREEYTHIGKQFREPLRYVTDPINIIGSKLSPFVRTAVEQGTGATTTAFPMKWSENKWGATLNDTEKWMARFVSVGEKFVPFSFRQGNKWFTFPSSKGITPYKAIRQMQDTFVQGDVQTRSKVIAALYKNNFTNVEVKNFKKYARSNASREEKMRAEGLILERVGLGFFEDIRQSVRPSSSLYGGK